MKKQTVNTREAKEMNFWKRVDEAPYVYPIFTLTKKVGQYKKGTEIYYHTGNFCFYEASTGNLLDVPLNERRLTVDIEFSSYGVFYRNGGFTRVLRTFPNEALTSTVY